MSEELKALKKLGKIKFFGSSEKTYGTEFKFEETKEYDILETALKDYEKIKEEKVILSACRDLPNLYKKLKALEIIEENLKYGYVFIGYDKDHTPLFQFADPKLYERIKKN